MNSIFTPDQFSTLLRSAVLRETTYTIETRRTLPAKSDWRRLQRYRKLMRVNENHRFCFRVAYRYDPGTADEKFIDQCLANGTLVIGGTNVSN
jgi:uncharacterized protein YggL (DUF469 family)